MPYLLIGLTPLLSWIRCWSFISVIVLNSILSGVRVASQFSFGFHLRGTSFSNPSLSVCVCPYVWSESLVSSIKTGLVFLSMQPHYVLLLEDSVHLQFKKLSILPFCSMSSGRCWSSPLALSPLESFKQLLKLKQLGCNAGNGAKLCLMPKPSTCGWIKKPLRQSQYVVTLFT